MHFLKDEKYYSFAKTELINLWPLVIPLTAGERA
jgi:hypothetical protein